MRWHDQLEDSHRASQLPGLDDAVVRSFDAPEALEARFHEIHAKSALNRVPGGAKLPFGWTVNPYRGCLHSCTYCFARPTHEYLDLDAGRDFEKQIIVKVNAPEVLRAELRRPSWRFEHVALGTNTDPYQWVEKRYRLTRAILEALRDARNPCSVLTKSPLLLRDLDLFLELREVTDFSACLSIPTLDERAWRATEPHTPHPRKRLEAVAQLNEAGIPTGVLVAPLMPGLNDAPEQVAEVVEACRTAGATRVGGQALFLRGATKDVFMGHLRAQRPDLVPIYEELYGRRAYLRDPDKRRVEAPLRRLAQRYVPELADRFQRCAEDPGGADGSAASPQGPVDPTGRGVAVAAPGPQDRTGRGVAVAAPGPQDRTGRGVAIAAPGPQDRTGRGVGAAAATRVGAEVVEQRALAVVRGGPAPLDGAERRFRGYALAEAGRPPHFASPRGAPRRPATAGEAPRRPATAAEVATGRAPLPRDAVEAAEARRRAPVQDALF